MRVASALTVWLLFGTEPLGVDFYTNDLVDRPVEYQSLSAELRPTCRTFEILVGMIHCDPIHVAFDQ
jgi:hypothetical protein